MHPAMQRRRHRLMVRRHHAVGASRRRGLAGFFFVTFAVIGLMFVGTIAGTVGGLFAAYNAIAATLPDPRVIDTVDLPESTLVYDRTGKTLLARFECQNRDAVAFDEIPKHLVDATVSIEDRTFWTNDGIDYYAVARALYANWRAGDIVQGASTITQQMIDYARVLAEINEATEVDAGATPAPDATAAPQPTATPAAPAEDDEVEDAVCRPPQPRQNPGIEDKIREQIMARRVTAAYPGRDGKERILTTYLNLVFYGNGSYGIKAAAANYFGLTDLAQLTLAQSAFLAGLPQRPSDYDPFNNGEGPAPAMQRRDQVLDAMLRDGHITRTQHREATATTWEEMKPSRVTSPLREPHFTYRVRSEAERILASLDVANPALAVRTGGYRITTTIDLELQQVAHEQVKRHVEQLKSFNVNNAALVSINSATGEIVAYVGSVDFYNTEAPEVQGEFDVAGLGVRQPGSAFKPITYASAFKARRATPATLFVDALTEFSTSEQGSYKPTNADIKEHGPVLAVDALRYSLNIPSVQMQYLAGTQETAEFAETLGIASAEQIMAEDPGLSLALGSVPVNLTNLTQAYGVFAQQGTLHPATTVLEIRDRDNRVVYRHDPPGDSTTKPMTPAEAYLMHYILEGNTDPRRNALWGERAQLETPDGRRRPAAFKTGTTNDFRDVSGFGYVPGSLVTGVWMGNNNQEPMSNQIRGGLFAADGPLFLWHDFMVEALNKPWEWNGRKPVGQTAFQRPEEIEMVRVCRWTGLRATRNCGRVVEMPFLPDTVPPTDNLFTRGCLDLVGYLERAQPERPESWIDAAREWSARLVTGATGARGDPGKYMDDERVRFAIAPLYGESGFPPVCGQRFTRAVAPIAPVGPAPPPPGGGGGGAEPAPPPAPAPTAAPGNGNGNGNGNGGGGGNRP
ncbi:MAG TPA: transglycosylase domain-containing protein [Candidatus Limnocylindria bacterium]|nr:transglycosylase domain-containing protein [Candidatus Limnocylindria bacterium]